jgi:hypothetical protein
MLLKGTGKVEQQVRITFTLAVGSYLFTIFEVTKKVEQQLVLVV